MNNPTRLSGFCGTPIGLKRDGARPPWSRRDSEASDYSCAYEVDVDGLDEGDLVKLKLPELPPHVRDAFRAVARGDAAALEAALDGDERLVYCANQGGRAPSRFSPMGVPQNPLSRVGLFIVGRACRPRNCRTTQWPVVVLYWPKTQGVPGASCPPYQPGPFWRASPRLPDLALVVWRRPGLRARPNMVS